MRAIEPEYERSRNPEEHGNQAEQTTAPSVPKPAEEIRCKEREAECCRGAQESCGCGCRRRVGGIAVNNVDLGALVADE